MRFLSYFYKKKQICLILNMEVNILAFIATTLFILIPTSFLIVLYVKTESQV